MANHSWVRAASPITEEGLTKVLNEVFEFTKLDLFATNTDRYFVVYERVKPTKKRPFTEEVVLEFWVKAKGPTFKRIEFRFPHYEGDIGAWIMFLIQYHLVKKYGGDVYDEDIGHGYVPKDVGSLKQYLTRIYRNRLARVLMMMTMPYRAYLTKVRSTKR